jgi:hypothetical protein
LSITLYPYKLLLGEMEARIPGVVALLPGQFVRFEGEAPAYGKITGVRVVRKKAQASQKGAKPKSKIAGCVVRLRLLYGQPDLSPQHVTILNDAQMAAEVQRLQEPAARPVPLTQDLTLDAARLGALTLIQGDDFVLKYQTLMAFVSGLQRYQKVLIIDPLGLFENGEALHHCQAGQDLRLSIQSVGHQRFLDAFGELFPSGLRNWALQAIAASWPITQDFIGFERLLDWRFVSESPLKSLILQNQQAVLRMGVFAERPNQVMQWTSLIWQPCNVLDLSNLEAPWKALFYEEAVRMALQEAGSNVLTVLIYPEHYLGHWPDWLKQAEEAGLDLFVLASSQTTDALENMASTRVTAKSPTEICIEGRLTSGIPVTFSLSESQTELPDRQESGAPGIEAATITDLTSGVEELARAVAEAEVLPQRTPAPEPVQEHHQILDQLFANQISIEQSVMGRRQTPLPPPEEAQSPQPLLPKALTDSDPPKVEELKAEELEASTSLDYPDADEGAWSEAEPSYTPPQPTTPSSDEISFPDSDSWALDDFDFDLNLDQKPLDTSMEASSEALRLEYSSVSGAQFSDELSLPTSLSAIEQPGSAGYPEAAAVDFPQAPDTLPGEEVPVYHKAAEPENPYVQAYQPGDRVRHEKYGVGVVTKVVPLNDSVVLNITFESVGKRLLDPQLAQLIREAD